MILLLLTSALALSFVPLKNDAATTVSITDLSFSHADSKLTVELLSDDKVDDLAGSTFNLAIFDESTGGTSIKDTDVKALLTKEADKTVVVDLADALFTGKKTLYLDVIENDGTNEYALFEDGRQKIEFVEKESVDFAKDGDKVKITITLDADLGDLTGAKFVLGAISETPEKAASPDHTYTVKVTPSQILEATAVNGYFEGENWATLVRPFAVLKAKPTPVLTLLSATKAKCDLTEIPEGVKVMLKSGATDAKELTVAEGAHYVEIAYADLEENCILYYANEDEVPISAEETLEALPAFPTPTMTLTVDTGAAKPPKLTVSFTGELANKKLIMARQPSDLVIPLEANAPTVVTAEQLVGTSAYYIVTNAGGTAPESLPLVLAEAVFAQTPAAVADGNIPVTVEMTAGYYKAIPMGLIVHSKGESDIAKAEYTPFTWSDTTASTATASVPVSKLPESTRKDVESYVCPNYATKPAKMDDVVRLSTAEVLREATLPTVTVGDFDFVPAGLKLTVPLKSSANLTADAGINYAVAIYATAVGGDAPLGGADIKALLDGTDKTVVVELDSAVYSDQKSLYVDIVQGEEGQAPVSIITDGARKEAEFAAIASAVAIAKDGDTANLIITFTLSDELPEHATAKFVLSGEHDVAKAASPEKTYTVTMPIATLVGAPSTFGYFKGADMAKSTLPISLIELKPEGGLEHVSFTDVHATLSNAGTFEVWLKVGDAAAEKQTKVAGQEYYLLKYADLENAVIYYLDATGIPKSQKLSVALPAFEAPALEWVLATDATDKTPQLKLTFAEEETDRKLILVSGDSEVVVELADDEPTVVAPTQLVATSAYYLRTDATGDIPYTRTAALGAATFAQEKAAAADGKIPVTVTVGGGFFTAKPAGLLVHATGEDDKTKMKFYPFTWGTTAETAKEAKADVTVEHFKTITDKNIESYVCPDYSEAIPDEPVKISEAFVVIAKTEPVEPEPKDEGAFGQMVSLMAVAVSLFVLAL